MILIVDDHQDTARLLKTMLARRGYAVRTAGCGTEALDMLRSRRPAVAVVDMHMPTMTGLDLLRAMRSDPALAEVKVIVYSADTDTDLQRQSQALGAVDFLVKGSNWTTVCNDILRHAPPAH